MTQGTFKPDGLYGPEMRLAGHKGAFGIDETTVGLELWHNQKTIKRVNIKDERIAAERFRDFLKDYK
jgi:hypothetical protein